MLVIVTPVNGNRASAFVKFRARQAERDAAKIVKRITDYYESGNPELSVADFKKRFPFSLHYLPFEQSAQLNDALMVDVDGMIRVRDDQHVDSGRYVCAIGD